MNTSNQTEGRALGRERAAEAAHRPGLLFGGSRLVRRPSFLAAILAGAVLLATATPVGAAEGPPEDFYASHASTLKRHVDDRGMVNYREG